METVETTESKNAEFEKWKYKRYLLLLLGVVMMAVISIPYAWSVFNAPIAKEFLNIGQAELQFTFTVFMICYGVFGIVGGYLVGFFKTVKINLWIAAVLIFLSFLISSFATELWHFYIGFGVLGGAGVVFAYNAIIVNLTKWFHDRIGMATGFLMMGYGLGSFIIGNAYTAIVSSGVDWRTVFLAFGIVIALITAAGAFLMFFPPQGYKTPVIPARVDRHPVETLECTPGQMIRRPSFWCLCAMGTCTMMAGMGVISNGRNLILNVNPTLELSTVALVVGILSIASACGRVFTGFLNDYCGMKTNIRVSAFCVFLSTLLVALAITTQNYVFLVISFACAGFSTGMSVPDAAVVTRRLFGDKHYQVNFEIVMSNGIIHAFAATFVGGLYDISGGYVLPLFILAGLGLIGFICSWLIRKP